MVQSFPALWMTAMSFFATTTCTVSGFVVPVPSSSTIISTGPSPQARSLVPSSHILDSIISTATTTLTSSAATATTTTNDLTTAAATIDPIVLFLGLLATAVLVTVGPVMLAEAHTSDNHRNTNMISSLEDQDEEETTLKASSSSSSFRRFIPSLSDNDLQLQDEENNGLGMDRRGTLLSLVGGAVSVAASDALLGAAGNVFPNALGGGAEAASSYSIYGARWNGLYQRVASQLGRHGTKGAASPELLAWVSQSRAALANPELRAWLAAQRAFAKKAVATSLVEDGILTAGAAMAAVVTAQRNERDTTNVDDDDGARSDLATNMQVDTTTARVEEQPIDLSESDSQNDESTSTASSMNPLSSKMNTDEREGYDERDE